MTQPIWHYAIGISPLWENSLQLLLRYCSLYPSSRSLCFCLKTITTTCSRMSRKKQQCFGFLCMAIMAEEYNAPVHRQVWEMVFNRNWVNVSLCHTCWQIALMYCWDVPWNSCFSQTDLPAGSRFFNQVFFLQIYSSDLLLLVLFAKDLYTVVDVHNCW